MKRPIKWRGEQREGTVVITVFAEESWSRYMLEDGTLIRVKHVLSEIIRVDGEYDDEGDQEYICSYDGVRVTYTPEHLKRKEVREDGKEPDREDRSAG